MRLNNWYSVALIFIAVISAFFLSIQAGYNPVDDLRTMTRLDNSGPLNYLRHFFPQGRSYYYRPLTSMTYFFDRDLWGTIPSFMHLGNLLLHFFNAVTVYFVVRMAFISYPIRVNRTALTAALLFALHPITAESVCWISGRTDLLSCFFLLLAVIGLLQGLKKCWVFTILSGICLLLACLAKEVAVFALPGLLWLAFIYPLEKSTFKLRLKQRWLDLLVPMVSVAGYFVMRHVATVQDTGIKTAMKAVVTNDFDLFNKIRIGFKVYGFYFKKLFIPWPLNFGIVEISHWYVLPGILLLVLLFWCLWRRDVLGAFCLTAFCVLSPALLIPLGKMAWTPIAERYLYIPLALAVPAFSYWFYAWHERLSFPAKRRAIIVISLLVLIFFATTVHRSWLWQDNERLFRDTVNKSPSFVQAQTELASALMLKGKVIDADIIWQKMQSKGRAKSYILDDLNFANSLMKRGDLAQAREILTRLLKVKSKQKYDVLQLLLKLNGLRLEKTSELSNQLEIRKESLAWLLEEQRMKPSSFASYRLGKAYYGLNQPIEALSHFKKALASARASAHYRVAAERFIIRIEKELN